MPELGSAYVNLLVNTTGIGRGMAQGQRQLDAGLNRMERSVGQRLDSMSQRFNQLGRAMAPISIAAGGLFIAGIKSAANFETAIVEIGARTGIIGEELESVAEFAREMGATTVFSAQKAAKAFLQLTTSGYDVTESMAALPDILNLSAAGALELGFAADAVTDILKTFRLDVTDAGLVVEALSRASATSSATVTDLIAGFQNVGGAARAFGLTVYDTAASLAVLAENGIKSSEAGTLLRRFFTNITRPTATVQKAWDELGTSLYDLEGNARDFNDVLVEISASLDDLPAEDANRLAYELAGSYGLLGIHALASAEGIDKQRVAMDAATSAAEIAEARLNTFEGQIEFVRGSIETLLEQAFQPLVQENLKPLVIELGKTINSMREWVVANPVLTKTLTILIGALALMAPLLFVIGTAAGSIAAALPVLAALFAFMTGPVGLAAIAFAALGLAIQTNFLGLGTLVRPVVSAFRRGLRQIAATLRNITNFIGGFVDSLRRQVTDESGAIDLGKLLYIDVEAAYASGLEAGEKVFDGIRKGLSLDQADADKGVKLELPVDVEAKSQDYTVKTDDTLWDIWIAAGKPLTEWATFLDWFKEANPGVDPSVINAGMNLVLPANVEAVSGTYTVKTDDTLWDIWTEAKKPLGDWALFLAWFKEANPGIEPDVIKAGMNLVLPANVEAVSQDYTVQEGDTLRSIWEEAGKPLTDWAKFLAWFQGANPGVDAEALETGVTLQLPAMVDVKGAVVTDAGEFAGQVATDIGETLFNESVVADVAFRVGRALGDFFADLWRSVGEAVRSLGNVLLGWTEIIAPGSSFTTGVEHQGLIDAILDMLLPEQEPGTAAMPVIERVTMLLNEAWDGMGQAIVDWSTGFAAGFSGADVEEAAQRMSAIFDGVFQQLTERVAPRLGAALASFINTLFGPEIMDVTAIGAGTGYGGGTESGTGVHSGGLLGRIAGVLRDMLMPEGGSLADMVLAGLEGPVDLSEVTAWIDANIVRPIQTWWQSTVMPLVNSVADFLLGAETMVTQGGAMFAVREGGAAGVMGVVASAIAGTILLGPVGGVVALLGSSTALLGLDGVTNWVETNLVQPVTQWWTDTVQPMVEGIVGALMGEQGGTLVERISGVVAAVLSTGVSEGVDSLLGTVSLGLEAATTWIQDNIIAPISTWWTTQVHDKINGLITTIAGEGGEPNIFARLAMSISETIASLDVGALFTVIADSIGNVLAPQGGGGSLAEGAASTVDKIVSGITAAFPGGQELVERIIDTIFNIPQEQATQDAARNLGETLGNIVGGAIGGALSVIADVSRFLLGYTDELGEWRDGLAQHIVNALFPQAEDGGEAPAGIVERVGAWLQGLSETVLNYVLGFFSGVAGGGAGGAGALFGRAEEMVAAVQAWLNTNILAPIGEAWAGTLADIEAVIFGAQSTVVQGSTSLTVRSGGITGAVQGVLDSIASIPKSIEGIVSGVGGAWENVRAEFDTFMAGVLGVAADGEEPGSGLLGFMSVIRDGLTGAVEFASLTITDPLTAIQTLFTTIMDRIAAAVQSVIDLITGLVEGAQAAAATVGNFLGLGGGGAAPTGPVKGPVKGPAPGVFEEESARASRGGVGNRRDAGGMGMAGMAYMIGRGAQPELFVPQTNGQFIPNADKMMGGGDTYNINITPPTTRDGSVDVQGAQQFGSIFLAEVRRGR